MNTVEQWLETIRIASFERANREDWFGEREGNTWVALQSPDNSLKVAVHSIPLDKGTYALSLSPIDAVASVQGGMTLPAIEVVTPPSRDRAAAEFIASSSGMRPWLGGDGGVVVIRCPTGGACVLIALYGAPEDSIAALEIEVCRLDRTQT